MLATRTGERAFGIAGDPQHPANFGRLCSKGAALGETLGLRGRLLYPQVRGERVSWDTALQQVAAGFAGVIERYGPEAVALYVSGQLLTEDYYVANKLVKGYFGTANIDTNSRLCMSSAVAGHKRAFGEDLVPCSYADLEAADLIVLVGSNTAWCHPVVYQRIVAAREQRPELRLVVVDPRRTPTCDVADLHLPIRAGTDVDLFNGLLAHLDAAGARDAGYVERCTRGAGAALEVARGGGGVDEVARRCGIDAERLARFYALFAATPRVVTLFSQGVNQSSSGTDKVNAIINCHLLTARIGQPGAGPFSITGQPNAMGGREVGGLANMLAAHLELAQPAHRQLVQEFWRSPRIADKPGLKAVELFDAIGAGRVKAIWIMATNPAVSLPDADRVRAALRACELVVVSDCVADTDTTRLAHVLLPAAAWGEKDGTVTNSERRISRQRAFLEAPGEARPDWWMVCEVAKRMGFGEGFGFGTVREVFLEHAGLSKAGNRESGIGNRDKHPTYRYFNLAGLSELSADQYDQLEPVRWPVPQNPATSALTIPDSPFPIPGPFSFIPTTPHPPIHTPTPEYPFVLNTGRIRDQWHTMTRTGQAPRLCAHRPEPFVEIHPQDALEAGVRHGELARLATRWGAMVARVRCTDEQRRGDLFVPIHWSDVCAADARTGALVNPVVDPVSGEPEFKHTPVRIEPFGVDWHGFLLLREPLEPGAALDGLAYWARAAGGSHERYEFAARGRGIDWSAWARALPGSGGDWLDFADDTLGAYRAVRLVQGRLQACVFVSARTDLPERGWLAGLFAQERLAPAERRALLAGQPGAGGDAGPPVCACFGVGRRSLQQAIRTQGCDSVTKLGQKLRAGTNCGSCVPELRRLIAQTLAPAQ